MRGGLLQNGERYPPQTRLAHPSGQYSPRPLVEGVEPDTSLPPPISEFTVTSLSPFHVYEFQVYSENSLGKVASTWASGHTAEAGEFRSKRCNITSEKYRLNQSTLFIDCSIHTFIQHFIKK